MAKLIIPAGYGLFQFFFRDHAGHKCVNEVGTSFTGTVGQSDVDGVSTAIAPKYGNLLSTSSHYDGLKLTYSLDLGELRKFESTAGILTGGSVGAMTSPQVQFVSRKITPLVGRKFQGRVFFPDVAEADVDPDGTLTVGSLTKVKAITDQFVASLHTAPFSGPVLLHSGVDTPPTPLTSFLAATKAATLRRRYDR